MANHGKQFLVDFTDKERHMLKEYFQNLDADGSGNIFKIRLNRALGTVGSVYFYGDCEQYQGSEADSGICGSEWEWVDRI
jgi:hypothetical protein